MRHSFFFRLRGQWLALLPAVAILALHPSAAWAQTGAARLGTPSFLGAVDVTLRVWSLYLQKFGLYVSLALGAVFAYLFGLIVYQALVALGTFAPRAGSVAAWVSALVLLFVWMLMLPLTWPWWAPYAFFFGGLFVSALLISSLSKKAA